MSLRSNSYDRAFGFDRRDVQAHLLAKAPGQEAAHAVRLPAGSFHQGLEGRPAGTLQQVENLGGFAALAPPPLASPALAFVRAFGPFLARLSFFSAYHFIDAPRPPPKGPPKKK